MREQGFDVTTMSSSGKEVADVVKDGTKHIVIPFTRKITPLKDLRCLWKLVREIRKLKPDIVHTHTPKAGLIGMLAAWICRVPVRLHTVAGLPLMEAKGLRRFLLETTERITYACAHGVFPNSVGLKNFIGHRFKVSANKLKVIGNGSSNGINTAFFNRTPDLELEAQKVRLKYNIKDDDIVFSFVGRIVRDKGIVELVHAFKAMSDEFQTKGSGRKLFLAVVGDFETDLDPLPLETLHFLMNDNRILLPGFQSDIRPWLMASDIFVFPSYREGFPNVVMQACLLKIPCVVTNINGCNEIIRDGSTGLIVNPKNVGELIRAMKGLLADDHLRACYAQKAFEYVSDNFRREVIWDALRNEYTDRLHLKR
jgi:glycosyltransferase involved in cell wall biosynthesis